MSDGSYTRDRLMKLYVVADMFSDSDLRKLCMRALDGDEEASVDCFRVIGHMLDWPNMPPMVPK